MNTRDLYPHEILQEAIGKSCAKSEFSIKMLVILSFLGGGYVGFGYLACLRVISGNLAGAVAMAYFLGHYVGLAEGAAAAKTIAIAEAKVNMDFGRAFVSAIACNWMVCMGIWFYFSSRHTSGRILATWFPVMIFVLIGFQHFVANMFIIPAGIWAGANVSWGQFFYNMIPVFLGNVLGGSSFVAAFYLFAYKHLLKDDFSI